MKQAIAEFLECDSFHVRAVEGAGAHEVDGGELGCEV